VQGVGTNAGTVTVLNPGTGADAVVVGSAASTVDGVAGPLSVLGNGPDTVTVNDAGNTAGKTVTLRPTGPAGVAPAAITYANIARATILLGGGNDAVTVPDTIPGRDDPEHRSWQRHGRRPGHHRQHRRADRHRYGCSAGRQPRSAGSPTMDLIRGPLSVVGGGSASLTLDDSGSTAADAPIVTATAVAGLGPVPVSYSGLANLAVRLGGGNNDVRAAATAAGTATTVVGGNGDDAFAVRADAGQVLPTANAGTLALDGGTGRNTLAVDDSTDPVARTVSLTRTRSRASAARSGTRTSPPSP
jgi:hypothetical protein